MGVAASEVTAAPMAPAWSPPAEIALASDALNEPIAIADVSGAVNLFFADGPAERAPTTVLRYRRWAQGRWSETATLLASAGNAELLNPALALDERGWLHAAYGGAQWRRIEYRHVPLMEINDPHAWTRAEILSANAGLHSAVATAPGGLVYVMYATHDHDVSFHHSEDGGDTWSPPTRVSDLDVSALACDDPRLAVDGRGRVHAVWTQFHLPAGWPPAGAYFSRSDDGGRTWRAPQQIAGEGNGRIAVIAHDLDQVHLVWSTMDGERMHVWSNDGGETWTPPSPVGEGIRGAVTRGLALAFDSAGILHLVAGLGGLGGGEPLVQTTWNGTAWSEPQPVSQGAAKQSVGLPSLAISRGNQLHVVYAGRDRRLWATDQQVDAPAIAARSVPTPPRDLRTRLANTSWLFRGLVALLVALGCEAAVSSWWRRRRAGASATATQTRSRGEAS